MDYLKRWIQDIMSQFTLTSRCGDGVVWSPHRGHPLCTLDWIIMRKDTTRKVLYLEGLPLYPDQIFNCKIFLTNRSSIRHIKQLVILFMWITKLNNHVQRVIDLDDYSKRRTSQSCRTIKNCGLPFFTHFLPNKGKSWKHQTHLQ